MKALNANQALALAKAAERFRHLTEFEVLAPVGATDLVRRAAALVAGTAAATGVAGDWGAARDLWRAACTLEPHEDRFRLSLAEVLVRLGELPDARRLTARPMDPKFSARASKLIERLDALEVTDRVRDVQSALVSGDWSAAEMMLDDLDRDGIAQSAIVLALRGKLDRLRQAEIRFQVRACVADIQSALATKEWSRAEALLDDLDRGEIAQPGLGRALRDKLVRMRQAQVQLDVKVRLRNIRAAILAMDLDEAEALLEELVTDPHADQTVALALRDKVNRLRLGGIARAARAAEAAGEWGQAATLLERLPDRGAIFLRLAGAQVRAGRAHAARRSLAAPATDDPLELTRAAALAARIGADDLVEELLELATPQDPTGRSWLALARLLLRQGRLAEALTSLEKGPRHVSSEIRERIQAGAASCAWNVAVDSGNDLSLRLAALEMCVTLGGGLRAELALANAYMHAGCAEESERLLHASWLKAMAQEDCPPSHVIQLVAQKVRGGGREEARSWMLKAIERWPRSKVLIDHHRALEATGERCRPA